MVSVGHRCSLLSFSSLGEIIGYRKVFRQASVCFVSLTDLCLVRFILDADNRTYLPGIQRILAITSVNTAQLRYVYPKSQIGRGMGTMRW